MTTTQTDIAPQTAKKDTGPTAVDYTLSGVAVFLGLAAASTIMWGLPGLAMFALACVPVMFVVLLTITVGK